MKIQMKVPKLRRNNKYMKIGSFSLIKELNTSIILNTIKEKGSISRAEIAKLTGLTAATVTNITSQLLKYNLVIETRYGASSGGRKPILLEFNYSYYNVIGVVISKQEITTSLTDLNSNLIKDIKVNLKDNVEKKDVINIVIKNTKELINFSEKKVLGLGVSVEGLIDEKNGVVVMSSSLGWKNFNIKNELNKELHIPIFINNDVKALAKNIPERHFNRRKCRHKHSSASPISISVYIVPMLFYLKWIFTNEIFLYMLNSTKKSLFFIFKSCLSYT